MTNARSPEVASTAARVELATVLAVNIPQFSLNVMTTFTHRHLTDVPFASPYVHSSHRGGATFMPEVGAQCYVVLCGDGTSFVLGFVVAPGADTESEDPGVTFRGMRPPLEPGDIMLGTRDRNFAILRRGGLVEVGATPMAQRLYIPIQNTIRDYFQRYEAFSPLGEISWGHPTLVAGEDVQGDADSTPVLVRYSIKHRAQEDVTSGKYTVEVRMGDVSGDTLDKELDAEHLFANPSARREASTLPGDAKGVLSFTIYSHVSKKVTYTFQLSQEGDVFLSSSGSVHAESDGEVYARIRKSLRIDYGSAPHTLELTEGGDARLSTQTAHIRATAQAKVQAPLVVVSGDGGAVTVEDAAAVTVKAGQILLHSGSVGGAAMPVVRDNGLLANVAAHTHPVVLYLTAPECAAIVAAAAAVAVAPAAVVPVTATAGPADSLAGAQTAASTGTLSR